MATYPVVRIGKMASTTVDSFVKSAKYAVAGTAISNGSHVILTGLVSGDLNTYVAATPTSVTTQEVFLVESPVLVEVNGLRVDLHDPRQFQNPADTPFRVRKLVNGDRLTMTADGFASAPTVGQYAVPANTALTLAPATDLNGATLVAYKVLAQRVISIGQSQVTAYEIEVVRSL